MKVVSLKRANHSTEPEKYPSINHQLLDQAIKSGMDPSKYAGTVPLNEVPAFNELVEEKK